MKRFSIFCAAILAAATSFAAVTYELNGGVQSSYLTPQDMYADFNADYNAATGATATWLPLAECTATNQGIPTAVATIDLTYFAGAGADKWGWLATYVDKVSAEQGVAVASSSSASMRYNLQSFFKDWQHTGWPKSADYTTCGVSSVAAYQAYWKSAFANPTEPTEEYVLNAPYKEGATFDGWYATADFSGEKVTTINAETTGTLYAKWIEYIPSIAEVKALADNSETKVSGVVNFISGKNVYIQDATGGILVYTTEAPTCKVGDKIIVKGLKVMYVGAPEVKNAVVESAEASELPATVKLEDLSALINDTVFQYYATNVQVPGLVIESYDSYNNPTVKDAIGNTAVCYKMSLDPANFPIGSKVIVKAVAGWYNGFQFVGDPAGIELAVAGVKEDYTYPTRHGMYSLKNNWVISSVEDNFAANAPGGTDRVRGMAVKDGIMHFIFSINDAATNSTLPLKGQIVRVNGATGEMLEPLEIKGEHLFERETEDGTWAKAVTLAHNDIKFDQAGNCLIGACTGGGGSFQIYTVDLETGEATLIIDERLYDNPDFTDNGFRFDAFGVAGDVKTNGVVMAADANSWNVYRWLITDGVAAPAEQITMNLDPEVDKYLANTATSFGTAPQIFPQDEEGSLFYVDGFSTLPMLFDIDGALIDDFAYNETYGTTVTNNEGETLTLNTGLNGLCEFQIGEEYFLIMVGGHTVSNPPSTFVLYKFADEYRTFEEMEPLWYFPHNGLGSLTIGCRTAVPSVEVEGNTAKLYIYATNNGYACYTFTIGEVADGLENVEADAIAARKVVENGQVYVIKNGVKYNVLGSEVK